MATFTTRHGTFADVAPVTRTHEVLAGFGHRITRQVLPNGSLGVYTLHANPDRADRWGAIPEADYAVADDAEAAPLQGPVRDCPMWAIPALVPGATIR